MTVIQLEFLRNQADEDKGLGDAGIETFRDAPYAGAARECGQNSRDAMDSVPVVITFDEIELAAADIPGFPALVAAVDCCLKKAERSGDEKELDFFRKAAATAGRDRITVLRVADFNTKGLRGPCVPGTPFHSLVKSAGVSNKDSSTSTGSFGIGKNAAFAISDLQTVFYSTAYREPDGTSVFLAQGKTILVSHTDSQDVPREPTGYWGAGEFKPMTDPDEVPAWLRREAQGTSIYAVGFTKRDDWQNRMVVSLMTNFFAAIHREEMKFSIGNGQLVIDRDNLYNLFMNDAAIEAAADASGIKDAFEQSRALYECLISNEAVLHEVDVPDLGKVSIRVLVRDGMPRKVCIVRNGMYISDNLEKFGHKFATFPGSREFIALVEPVDDSVSALLKKLEDPKHNNFSAERLSDDAKRKMAIRAMKALGRLIRSTIKQDTQVPPTDEQQLDELSKFFADLDRADEVDPKSPEKDPEFLQIGPARRKKKVPAVAVNEESGDDGGAGAKDGTGAGGDGTGSGYGSGSGGAGDRGRRPPVQLLDVRNLSVGGGHERREIFFTPAEGGKALISVVAPGMMSPAPLAIRTADRGTLYGNRIRLELEAHERVHLSVTLEDDYRGPIELLAVMEQPEGVDCAPQ
ncbi:MAG: hypothetical protein J0M16_01370 [Gammaproteobacteria bacterium]|nr:hypothetical protein [Gammaproteobacteria bacterium]